MSLIIATGSNLGDKESNLSLAKSQLQKHFNLIAESRIYTSPAVDYLNQPDFYNQVLEFELPGQSAKEVLIILQAIEKEMGRRRDIPKGPRTLDLDIIFYNLEKIEDENLSIPHPSWAERSFVTLPLAELPFFKTIEKTFIIPKTFNNTAEPI